MTFKFTPLFPSTCKNEDLSDDIIISLKHIQNYKDVPNYYCFD